MKLLKEILPYLIIVIVVVLFRTFIATPVRVDGSSMDPTLKNGQILILKKYDKSYKRFDIVVIKTPSDKIIKRIIGLPGDNIEYKNNILYINGIKHAETFKHEFTDDFKLEDIDRYKKIPKDKYLVLGDNRTDSYDSRMMGLISEDKIVGSVNLRLFPLNKIGIIK